MQALFSFQKDIHSSKISQQAILLNNSGIN